LVLMAVNLLGTDKAFFAQEGEESAFMVPAAKVIDWEKLDPQTGTHTNTFLTELKKHASKYE
ncbi:MAG: hypothetical protein WCN98_17460, partial [Verrucomicrobiaceae bacterium]